jgi:AcrR family transcriptional regulator
VPRAVAERNRALLVDVARRVIESGTTDLQLNAIAREAGVGVGTAYRHFPSPQALLEAVAEDSLATLVAAVEDATADPDPWAGFQRMLRLTLDLQLRDSGLAALLQLPNIESSPTQELARRLDDAVEKLMVGVRKTRKLRTDVTDEDIRCLLAGILVAVRTATDPTSADRYLTVLVSGLQGSA